MQATDPIVESQPVPADRTGAEELAYRLRQQEVLAEFGRVALESCSLDALLDSAMHLCADGMRTRYCKLLEFLPKENRLIMRAGVGWKPGYIGRETLDLDMDSPAGFAFRTGQSVVSNHLENEQRFRTPRLLAEHDVKRATNVVVRLSQNRHWGVLAADSDDAGKFDKADAEFLEGMAQLLGVAIERQEAIQRAEQGAALIRLSQDAIIVWSRETGIESWSDGAEELYGYSREEALKQSLPDLLKTSPAPSPEWERAWHDEGSWEGELQHVCKDGHAVIVSTRLQSIIGSDGRTRVLTVNREITERKRMEAALRASEECFRLLYEAQQTAHLVLAPDLTIEDASDAYLAATMTRKEDLVGKGMFEAFPDNPDDPGATGVRNLAASLARVKAQRRPDRMAVQKYDIRRPDGEFELRWWAPLNLPVFGPDGEVRHIIHQVEDVTAEMIERQRAAEALAGAARFRAMAEAIPGLVFETGASGQNTYVNQQYCAFTGLSTEALLGDGWLEVLHPEDRQRAAESWDAAVQTSSLYDAEYRFRRADGIWRWFKVRGTPIRGADGQVEKWIGVCTDIDEARRAQDALRESEQQFRNLAESLPQLTWMADRNGYIYWYNRRWYEYTGTTLDEMKGWGWRKVHHPDHVERVTTRIQHSWDTGEPWEDTFPLRGADGRYRWFLSRAMPIRDAEGRVACWFGTNTDITENKKLEDLQKLLVHEMSHRVKNNLMLVSSLLAMTARNTAVDPRKVLNDAASRVHAIASVYDQFWRQPDVREIDLGPLIETVSAAIATTAPRHATTTKAEHAIVSADIAVPVGLLINELATNAYKHAYPKDGEGEVGIFGTCLPEDRYRIDVWDHGKGLPVGFDLSTPRTSLGMRVITALTKQIDGELSIEAVQPGTRFSLTFPIRRPAAPPASAMP